jgi:hypothetical protein
LPPCSFAAAAAGQVSTLALLDSYEAYEAQYGLGLYTPSYEEPTYEEPKYEKPKYEEPKYEEPKYEEPKYEEESKYDAPKYESKYEKKHESKYEKKTESKYEKESKDKYTPEHDKYGKKYEDGYSYGPHKVRYMHLLQPLNCYSQ